MDQLVKAMADKIKLHQGEENLVPLGGGTSSMKEADFNLSLIGRVVIDRELSATSIRNNVLRLLRPLRGADIQILSTNMFRINFKHRVDRKNALEGCPWAIEKHAMLLSEIDSTVPLTAHIITDMKIVIRIHDFPIENQNTEAATAIGLNFGKLVGILKSGGMNQNQFFRLKVLVDVSLPLKRGFFALDEYGKKKWYRVTYERLPMFCFLCGILGHGEAHCSTRYDDDFLEPEEGFPFGNWLRASMDNSVVTEAPLPLQPLDARLIVNTQSISVMKWGNALLGEGKENVQEMGDSSSFSGSNKSDGGRRRIDPSKLKRKHKPSNPLTEDRNTRSRQLHLSLVDENIDSTAEAAQQPRRLQ